MRILVITDFYPPHHFGGYAIRCRDVVNGLLERGHEIKVITSVYGVEKPLIEEHLERCLNLCDGEGVDDSMLKLMWLDLRNRSKIKKLINEFHPDVIHLWNMNGYRRTAKSLLMTVEKSGIPVVYSLGDDWMLKNTDRWLSFWSWTPNNKLKRWLKNAVKTFVSKFFLVELSSLKMRYAHFVSNSLKDRYIKAGFSIDNPKTIHSGINIKLFHRRSAETENDGQLNLLYVGRIQRSKGTHTAVEAVSRLLSEGYDIVMRVIGADVDLEYTNFLKSISEKSGSPQSIEFIGKVSHSEMANFYSKSHILIFPSIIDEGFSRTILEAMACGLAVVGTTTGGSIEVLFDEDNSLTFAAEDTDELVRKLKKLISDPLLRKNISSAGEKMVKQDFTMDNMIDNIETYLQEAVE